MSQVRVILEMPEAQYKTWVATHAAYEDLPEDYNPDDYAGGNMDDAFQNGEEHGWDQAITDVIGFVVEVKELE